MVERLVNSEANARRISMVESCFGSSGQPLGVPGRVLVGEGVLTKMCRKKPKPRQFFLFNDILVYGNIIINKKKYNKQHITPLEEIKLENLEDENNMRNGWLMCTASKSFAVYAATATEKSEWMLHINNCVAEVLKKSGKKAKTEHAAVWVPDAEATLCMHCKKTHFTVISRRHHCRACGLVVCAPCSSKKFLLPNQSSKPVRVCLTCYDTLSRAKTTGVAGQGYWEVQSQQAPISQSNDGRATDFANSSEDDSDDDDEVQKFDTNGQNHENFEPTFYDDSNRDFGGDRHAYAEFSSGR